MATPRRPQPSNPGDLKASICGILPIDVIDLRIYDFNVGTVAKAGYVLPKSE